MTKVPEEKQLGERKAKSGRGRYKRRGRKRRGEK